MNNDICFMDGFKMRMELPINSIGKDYIVGDIHGEYSLFMKALRKLNFRKDTDRIICTGDLIDRGPESSSVIELLHEDYFFSTLGNHEQMLIKYGLSKTKREYYWYPNGGEWWNAVNNSDQKYYLDLINSKMPLIFTLQCNNFQIGIVHADFPSNLSWNFTINSLSGRNITSKDFIWTRTRIEKNNSAFIKGINYVFIGHTPLENVTHLGNCIFIDTGCGHNASNHIRNPRLTICEIYDDNFIFHNFKK